MQKFCVGGERSLSSKFQASVTPKRFSLPHSCNIVYNNLKIQINKTIKLRVVLYGCETWSLTLTSYVLISRHAVAVMHSALQCSVAQVSLKIYKPCFKFSNELSE